MNEDAVREQEIGNLHKRDAKNLIAETLSFMGYETAHEGAIMVKLTQVAGATWDVRWEARLIDPPVNVFGAFLDGESSDGSRVERKVKVAAITFAVGLYIHPSSAALLWLAQCIGYVAPKETYVHPARMVLRRLMSENPGKAPFVKLLVREMDVEKDLKVYRLPFDYNKKKDVEPNVAEANKPG